MAAMATTSPRTRDVLKKIQGEMALQIGKCGAPEEVHAFLMQVWARLLTGIFLARGNRHSDWQAGWETANALLWSLAPKRGKEETSTLLRSLPTLLSRLQDGCNAMRMATGERDALFERLALLHAAVAREGLQTGAVKNLPMDTEAGRDAMDLRELTAPDLPAADPQLPLPELKLGDRVVFRIDGVERRLMLTWLSPMRGMYLFSNEQGLDAVSLTRARLEAKFRNREAWPAA